MVGLSLGIALGDLELGLKLEETAMLGSGVEAIPSHFQLPESFLTVHMPQVTQPHGDHLETWTIGAKGHFW